MPGTRRPAERRDDAPAPPRRRRAPRGRYGARDLRVRHSVRGAPRAPWNGAAARTARAPHRPTPTQPYPAHTDRATRYRNTFGNQTLPSEPVYG